MSPGLDWANKIIVHEPPKVCRIIAHIQRFWAHMLPIFGVQVIVPKGPNIQIVGF